MTTPRRPTTATPGSAAPLPPGTAVHDTASDRVGLVMGHEGPYFQLRPLFSGREWDADPVDIHPLTPTELLHARVAEANARSRRDDRVARGGVAGRA